MGASVLLGAVPGGLAASEGIPGALVTFGFALLQLNLLLAVFNMLPIPPLDGGNVLAGLLPEALAAGYDRLIRPFGFLILNRAHGPTGWLSPAHRSAVLRSHGVVAPVKPRVVSGMRPTGKLHLGHLVGALRQWAELQSDYDCMYFVADWHALTSEYADTDGVTSYGV